LALLGGEIFPPHLLLVQALADDGEPNKFHPLDSIASEEFYPFAVPSPISGLDEELLDKPKPAQFHCLTGPLACSHAMSVLNLSRTIYWEQPCSFTPSSVIKSIHDDVDEESQDYDLLVSNLSAQFSSTTRGHLIPICSVAVSLDTEFGFITSATPPEVCMPLHADPAPSALTMVAIDGEPLPDQQLDVWNSHEPPLILKLLTCNALTNMDLDACTVFEEEIVFDTDADGDLELMSEDDIFLEDALCVPFSTSLLPHHDQSIMQDVLQESALQDVLHSFVSPPSHFAAGMSSTPLPDCFHQVPMLIHPEIHPEHYLEHLGWLPFHLPVLYKVMESLLQDMHLCFPIEAVCTICGELKATHNVKPNGTLVLTSLKGNDCISGVIEPSADADDLASVLDAFIDGGEFSTAWLLPPNNNVSSGKPRLLLPYKLLAEGPLKALLLSDACYFKARTIASSSVRNEELRVRGSFVAIEPCAPYGMLLLVQGIMETLFSSDDWSYVVDEFAPEVYPQVLSVTTFCPPPSSEKMAMRCVYGNDLKCSNSLLDNISQHVPVKIDDSQFYMGSKTWSNGFLKTSGFVKYLTLLIAISGNVASFPYDRGKMASCLFPSCPIAVSLPCSTGLCQARLVCFSLPLWSAFKQCCLHVVTPMVPFPMGSDRKFMGSDTMHKPHLA